VENPVAFCENISWLPLSAKRSGNSIHVPPRQTLRTLRLYVAGEEEACQTVGVVPSTGLATPFLFHVFFWFLFARFFCRAFRHGRAGASFGCPEVFICESIFVGFAEYSSVSRKRLASFDFSRVFSPHGCQLRHLSRLGRCKHSRFCVYCRLLLLFVPVYTAFGPAARNALLQRRPDDVAYSCSATPSRVGFRLSLRQLRPTQVWIPYFPLPSKPSTYFCQPTNTISYIYCSGQMVFLSPGKGEQIGKLKLCNQKYAVPRPWPGFELPWSRTMTYYHQHDLSL
jgi:hypothetical protein